MKRYFETPSVVVTEALYPSEVMGELHAHSWPYFKVVLNGMYRELEKNRSIEHHRQSIATQPKDEPHRTHIAACGLHYLRVDLAPSFIDQIDDRLDCKQRNLFWEPQNIKSGPLLHLGSKLYSAWKNWDFASPLILEGLILEITGEVLRANQPEHAYPAWMKKLEDRLQSNLEAGTSLADLSLELGVHPVMMARWFRRKHRQSIGEYVRALRVERATHDLLHSNLTLGEIAIRAGFADQSHFGRVVKRLTGATPGDIRRGKSPFRSSEF
ncbi:MAG: helix-turn-helix transcriptional regulator [Armatimonadetes bacterium]|nr:helix-turn-helix transcriptional regulator [Armatimonadota bacterium]